METKDKTMPCVKQDGMEIAIIGLGLRFPKSGTLDRFWNQLVSGKSSITEVPPERWDKDRFFGDPARDANKTDSIWGGFIDDADCFDASFFNISPREAVFMDPQQRIALELAWKAIEDAGYRAGSLEASKTGVFMGVCNTDYTELIEQHAREVDAYIPTGTSFSIISNRISYWFDFKGPSITIDTACASSLVALHQAVRSLANQECDCALAGGVNFCWSPKTFIALSQSGMLSKEGNCKAFDKSADGYVRGEGGAVLLLKPLSKAEAAGDHIYALIKGSATNHGGKTNSLTVTNPKAQADLIAGVYEKAGISPDTISYIETHGPGTPLGDPIEIFGLKTAFNRLYKTFNKKPGLHTCGLGSVKTNIGHLESASGIAGIVKVAASLKYKILPASIHFHQLNPVIKLEGSPFYIVDKTKPWEAAGHNDGHPLPRRAGVSSFGFGGTNAHIILEEYIPRESQGPCPGIPAAAGSLVPVPLSAKSADRLHEYALNLLEFFNSPVFENNDIAGTRLQHQKIHLGDLAYTLQTCREAMAARVVFLVKDVPGLIGKLDAFSRGKKEIDNCWQGQVKQGENVMGLLSGDEDSRELIQKWIAKGRLEKLAQLWSQGFDLDWGLLHHVTAPGGANPNGPPPRRIPLPTYPFARERHWLPESGAGAGSFAAPPGAAAVIHPLLQQNTSDFSEQRYTSTFTGREFFLADHVVKGRRVLPGVAHLEMARAAVVQALGTLKEEQTRIRLKNVVWAQPITLDEQPLDVHIRLLPRHDGEISFEIYSQPEGVDGEPVVYSQGRAVLSPAAGAGEIPPLDPAALQAQCTRDTLSSSQCYEAFRKMGLDYGPGHRGIETLYVGDNRVLARLALPASVSGTQDRFFLHPSLLDAALQASAGLTISRGDPQLTLPFALQELDILGPCTASMWALVRYADGGSPTDKVLKPDIQLCDEQGVICVRMNGFSARKPETEETGLLLFQPRWQEEAVPPAATAPDYQWHNVIFCEPGKSWKLGSWEVRKSGNKEEGLTPSVKTIEWQSPREGIARRFQAYALQVFEEIRELLKRKPRGKILFQVVFPAGENRPLFAGLSGLLKTARLENPNFLGQLIEVGPGEDSSGIVRILEENSRSPLNTEIRCLDGKRWRAGWSEIETPAENADLGLPWKERGIYLVTGGAGGLGSVFAGEIARQVTEATLVLTDRVLPGKELEARLNPLRALAPGVRVHYKQADITQKKAVAGLIASIKKEFGSLHGILHCAGLIRDNYILKKDKVELLEVLAPKVTGLVNLDHACRELPLDFFILFSSLAASLGNAGQSDYAAANAFMDAFAGYRNGLVAAGQRQGRTLAIAWPPWQEGGMKMDGETAASLRQELGITAMPTTLGIRAFYRGFASGTDRVMVMHGRAAQMKQKLQVFENQPSPAASSTSLKPGAAGPGLPAVGQLPREKAETYLKKLLASAIKLPVKRIEADAPLEKYGIDSILAMQLTNQLEKVFGSLPKTLFFEYQNLRELTGYFLETYPDRMAELLGNPVESGGAQAVDSGRATGNAGQETAGFPNPSRFVSFRPGAPGEKKAGPLDIAIIGLSGRYPGAGNLREFWQNLREGKDCVTEIPTDRWDHTLYFDAEKNKPGKTYSKWGGFLEGVDRFDSLFFNISPREAEKMDPQERLFLQCVFETLEDAGYTRESLSENYKIQNTNYKQNTKYKLQITNTENQHSPVNGTTNKTLLQGVQGDGFLEKSPPGRRRQVGVFVGVMYEEYQLYGAQETILGRPMTLYGNPSSIANRVSYFCDFHGPSMAVDTMCSSSLTAIHLACRSLKRGECELAVAGGVNLSIHPNKYLALAQDNFISSSGKCESFGRGGDGYVPGEGVGAVLLKPLAGAMADGDHIYGIIKGAAINHGGKTNGYTVPNPNAQAAVIRDAFQEAGIAPGTISYIEAHGTGTSLGDPIEVAGLINAFRQTTRAKRSCALGSVKSNIGHGESSAGIAGVTKVLLQLKHRQLAPTLHSQVLNPNIDFAGSPFFVQQELSEWKRPVVEIDGETREYPRRAGISSFGAGGSNGHVLIEEYMPEGGNRQERSQFTINTGNPVIIVLSAKNAERLREQVKRMLAALKEPQFTDAHLRDIAYTLQVGREAMEERLAFQTRSLGGLAERLAAFLEDQEDLEDFHRGRVKRDKEDIAVFTADEDMAHAVDTWIAKGKYANLLDLWVKGLVFDWNKLYGDAAGDGGLPRRVSLPTYPFDRRRHWLPGEEVSRGRTAVAPLSPASPPTEKILLREEWRHTSITPTGSGGREGRVIVLGTAATAALASALFKDTPAVQTTAVIHRGRASAAGSVEKGELFSDFYSAPAGEQLYQLLKEKWAGHAFLGVIDITAYDDRYEQSTAVESGKIRFMQKLLEHDRAKGFTLLQATHRLQAFRLTGPTLQGARLAGLYRMLGAEYKQIRSVTMDSDCRIQDPVKLAGQIQQEFLNGPGDNPPACCYREESRYEPYLKISHTHEELLRGRQAPVKYEPHEVILITGGSRGIGAAIAQHVVSRGVRQLVIMGREELPGPAAWKKIAANEPGNNQKPGTTEKIARMQALIDQGVRVHYDNTPLTHRDGITALVKTVRRELGPITGVFYCAGLTGSDPVFFKKPLAGIEAVCAPKLTGLDCLHNALAADPPAFFILFSSISAIVPGLAVGWSDYAMANAYMDYYARNQAGQGRTYFKAIRWPLWSETGMAAGSTVSPLYSDAGFAPCTTVDGLAFLEILRQTPFTLSLPCIVKPGNFSTDRLLKTEVTAVKKEHAPGDSGAGLRASVSRWLRGTFMSQLKLTADQLDDQKPFAEYGIDSIILTQLVQTMQKELDQPLNPALFLEHSTLAALTEYFALHHAPLFQVNHDAPGPSTAAVPPLSRGHGITSSRQEQRDEAIAVVGLSCRFPGSPAQDAYWDLLTGGKFAIKPVPGRWPAREDRRDWGGWLEDIDRFDATFFNINEEDAVIMDPQARLILEESLNAIYNAGYRYNELSGEKIGVYIGGRSQANPDVSAVLQAANPILAVGQNYLASNISRFFNFRGPGLVIDTACSSGLVGISLASGDLQRGRIDMALAGAVSLLLTPYAHDLFAARNILNEEGEFHIFDKRSGGEVLGEGAGIVVLKRLSDAVKDGNRVLGVIKGMSINNDGRTLGPGSPNLAAQEQVMQEALALSGKQVEDIGYIEVNGGGSPVSDAVELKALSDVYRLHDKALAPCFLGSVKPSTGHLLLASGIAGFIRCLLSVHHKQIPPFLSALDPAGYYDFSASRIRFNRETVPWQVGPGKKRAAAQNSFPDGGTNCHIILEEFVPGGTYRQQYFPAGVPPMEKKRCPLPQPPSPAQGPFPGSSDVPGSYAGKEMRRLVEIFKKEPERTSPGELS